MTNRRSIPLLNVLIASALAVLFGGCSMPTFYDRPSWSLFDKTAATTEPNDSKVAAAQTNKREPYALGAKTNDSP